MTDATPEQIVAFMTGAKAMTDIVERLRLNQMAWPGAISALLGEAAEEIERLRAIEDAAIDAATYFHIGDGGEDEYDEQRMVDLMAKLGRALEPKP